MKLVCIKDTHKIIDFSSFKRVNEKIYGLTLNKTYSACAPSNGKNMIDCFFVFDDNGKWNHYNVDLFAPLED